MDQIVQSCDIEVLNSLGNKISSFLLQNWAIIATVIIFHEKKHISVFQHILSFVEQKRDCCAKRKHELSLELVHGQFVFHIYDEIQN